jgi:hypothetical protein
MTKYQLIVLATVICSVAAVILGNMANDKKGIMFQLHRLFAVLTLLAVLLLGYRAFFLVR